MNPLALPALADAAQHVREALRVATDLCQEDIRERRVYIYIRVSGPAPYMGHTQKILGHTWAILTFGGFSKHGPYMGHTQKNMGHTGHTHFFAENP